ncbi:MAG TPA: hypothetical protein PJ990_17495, partial [Saprospiraceae bacterium]|nr:hypothetical protein [Saprospiraceae bacterium]
YNYLRVSLKHSLGQYSLAPMLDFNTDQNFNYKFSSDPPSTDFSRPSKNQSYPVEREATFRPGQEKAIGWEEIYKGLSAQPSDHTNISEEVRTIESEAFQMSFEETNTIKGVSTREPYQLHGTYIIHQIKTGMMVIDQQAAHERILYEYYLESFQNGELFSQKELFPRTIELDPAKASVLKKILDKVNALGFEMEEFGQNTFIVHGTPSGLDSSISIDTLIEKLLFQYVQNLEFELGIEDNLARSMAFSACIKRGKRLEKEEMTRLIDQLFGCKMVYTSPTGKKCFITIELDDLSKRFNQ